MATLLKRNPQVPVTLPLPPEEEEHENDANVKYKNKYFWLTVFVSNISALITGIHMGWLVPVEPKLIDELRLDENPFGRVAKSREVVWIRSSFYVGAILGPIVAAVTVKRIGRKNTLIVSVAAPYFVSLITLAFAKLMFLYYVGRFVGDFGLGSFFTTYPIYLGEISYRSIRGRVICSMEVFISLGIMLDLSVSPFLPISIYSFLCSVICAAFFIGFISFPDTPYYYINNGDIKVAERSLIKLRGLTEAEAKNEIQTIINEIENERHKGKTITQLFKSKSVRKSLIVTMVLVALHQLSGVEIVQLSIYSTFRVINSQNYTLSDTKFGMIFGGIQIVASIVPLLIVDWSGRKLLFLISGMGIIVSNSFLGIYYHAIEHEVYAIKSWIPLTSLTTFTFAFHLGYGPLPWTIMGEVFYATVRPLATMITTMFCYTIALTVILVTPVMTDKVGWGFPFFLFSLSGYVGVFFTELYLFETMNKSLGDIQNELNQ